MTNNNRQTAVTKQTSHEVTDCQICGSKTVLGDVPEDSVEPAGYAVLIGEGDLTRDSTSEGNWNQEFVFEIDESRKTSPHVQGCVVCEGCAKVVHDYSGDNKPFTGEIPSKIEITGTQNSIDKEPDLWLLVFITIVSILIIVVIII